MVHLLREKHNNLGAYRTPSLKPIVRITSDIHTLTLWIFSGAAAEAGTCESYTDQPSSDYYLAAYDCATIYIYHTCRPRVYSPR